MTLANAKPASTARPPAHRRIGEASADRWGTFRRLGLMLVAAWALVLVTYVLGVAWLVLPVIVVGTASLLRGGRTLLDRVMLASALLIGVVCVGGLLLSVWPLGLHPVAVGGTALTGLVLVHAVTCRVPNLPRPTLGDGITLAAAMAVGSIVAWPMLSGDASQRVAIFAVGEDLNRHFTVFDAIRQVGGYLFLHSDAAADRVFTGLITYPQGGHLFSALADGFVRSSADDFGSGLNAMEHYLGFVAFGFGFFTLAMVWAAQWIAPATLNLSRRILVVGIVAGFCLVSEIFHLVVAGYASQILGLAMVALLVAFLVRPIARTGDLLVVIASLLVGIGFTYYLYLPAAALATLAWAIRYRSAVLRHRLALAAAFAALLVAVVPMALGFFIGEQATALLVVTGTPGRDVIVAMLCVVGAGLLAPRALRSRRWRTYTYCVASVGTAALGLYTLQRMLDTQHVTGYYYTNKTVHLLLCVLCLGVGSLLLYLPNVASKVGPLRLEVRRAIPAALLVVAVAAGGGILFGDSPVTTVNSARGHSLARVWTVGGFTDASFGAAILAELQDRQRASGSVTVVSGDDPYQTYRLQILLAALQRTSGILGPGIYTARPLEEPARIENMVVGANVPVLLVVYSSDAEAEALEIKARHPDRQITVERALAGWGRI